MAALNISFMDELRNNLQQKELNGANYGKNEFKN